MRRALPWLSWALPVAVTGATLAGVAWNRSRPSQPIVLSAREVMVMPAGSDNTGRSLQVLWQGDDASWIDCGILRKGGMPCDVAASDARADRYYAPVAARDVFVCFELGGRAWERWLDGLASRTEEMRRRIPYPVHEDLERLRMIGSRLVPVDLDRDAENIRSRCPDDGRHLIAPAVLRGTVDAPSGASARIRGYLDVPLLRRVHVPRPLAARLPPWEPGRQPEPPRPEVHLRYGRRFEPWVVGIEP